MYKLTNFFKKLTYKIGLRMMQFSLKKDSTKLKNDMGVHWIDEHKLMKKTITSEFTKLNDVDTNYIIFKRITTNTNPKNLQLVIEYNNYMTMGYILTDEEIKFEEENDETLETLVFTKNIKHDTKKISTSYDLSEYKTVSSENGFIVDISDININPIDKVKCMVRVKIIDISNNLAESTIYYNLV